MKIKIGQEKAYKDWFDKNADPYGRACFTYAERWAELLEKRLTRLEMFKRQSWTMQTI